MWPWSKLEHEIERLKSRVDSLERRDTAPKMWADNIPRWIVGAWWHDLSKWEVTHAEVIRQILAHLGLEIVKTPEKPPEVRLEKPAPNPDESYLTTPKPKPEANPKRKAK